MRTHLQESADLQRAFAESHAEQIYQAASLIAAKLQKGGKLLICGNGGSAADSQHFAAEMIGRLRRERPPIAAIALTTDTSILTAIGNDYAMRDIFARQVRALGSAHDILVALSTSGRSENLINAVQHAKSVGMSTIGLLGRDGGALAQLVDRALIVPSGSSQRIQEIHITVIHIWCEIIEDILHPFKG
ncbi:D-sedoheptulose 7-phosphate isomerase [candidate division KSB1 bacterium]|nr:D-sedoheptulose 7-phosphate isomerase [candidate division KSB1 bacterium]RQW05299.1 MAG: SIS domain-containing protein [candidate division KSB1 bacterium]